MAQQNAQSTDLARRSEGNLARRSEGGAARWTPWDEFSQFHRQMDDLFSRMFGYTPLSRIIPGEMREWEPDVDLYETEDRIILTAALPGYAPEQINVETTGDSVILSGERKPYFEEEKATRHRQSWQSGFRQFRASFTLPVEIDPNKVKATFRNGVLHLEMPKTEQARTKSVKVNIQGA